MAKNKTSNSINERIPKITNDDEQKLISVGYSSESGDKNKLIFIIHSVTNFKF